ncbi:hypothetical protein SAMN04488008_11030 [Maribacter orientalis]|uniref:Uncharacterized protein n=1 Tax=Maribacter orientalis TaxID=228957 RepID=A0A1H7VZN3_9FLAO|nr:hypothetical protein [Maribacter orientalis]SEM14247.1 hypothetical protein SAMN04488008_11030 [Maribacter orientalis]
MLKPYKVPLAILLYILLQSCSKETDLISEFVVLDTAKTEYRSMKFNLDFEIEKSKMASKTVSVFPFFD